MLSPGSFMASNITFGAWKSQSMSCKLWQLVVPCLQLEGKRWRGFGGQAERIILLHWTTQGHLNGILNFDMQLMTTRTFNMLSWALRECGIWTDGPSMSSNFFLPSQRSTPTLSSAISSTSPKITKLFPSCLLFDANLPGYLLTTSSIPRLKRKRRK